MLVIVWDDGENVLVVTAVSVLDARIRVTETCRDLQRAYDEWARLYYQPWVAERDAAKTAFEAQFAAMPLHERPKWAYRIPSPVWLLEAWHAFWATPEGKAIQGKKPPEPLDLVQYRDADKLVDGEPTVVRHVGAQAIVHYHRGELG